MSNNTEQNYIGIDIGTSSVCGVLYDRVSRRYRSVTLPNDAGLESSREWERIQEPSRILDIVYSILRDFLKECPNVSGIGMTGQMHGILYYDALGKAVSPLYTWQDGRGALPLREGQTFAEFLTGQSGRFTASGYGLATHFYNLAKGIVPKDAVGLCTIMDYAVMRLTGRTKAVSDRSNAAALGLFDIERGCFDRIALDRAGIDSSFLPLLTEVCQPPGQLMGSLLEEIIETKSSSNAEFKMIPVFPAIGDNQAAFRGAVEISGPNDRKQNLTESVQITIGTGSQMAVWSEQYTEVAGLETRPYPGGGFLLVGAALSGGSSFALLKTFFEKTVHLFNPEVETEKIDFYRIMTSHEGNRGADNSLLAETAFSGTRTEPDKRGSIRNISTANFTPEDLIFAFEQGIIQELFEFYQKVPEKLRLKRRFIACSGNAIRKNEPLRLLLEKTFRLPASLSSCQEEAALGAAKIPADFSEKTQIPVSEVN